MQASPSTSFWTFTVVAAIVTTAGTLFGHLLKEVMLARSFERWKRTLATREVERKYRDPIILASIELASRITEILDSYPPDFLRRGALDGKPERSLSSHRDAYFQRYKCQSTVYRVAALFAWLELYRQDLVFMEADSRRSRRPIETCLLALREDLADGALNESEDWATWQDGLIFREEQRAIGEAMIVGKGSERTVMGYGAFISAAESAAHPSNRWLKVAEHFCLDHDRRHDFRRVRLQRVLVHLVELIRVLDASRLERWLSVTAAKHHGALTAAGQRGFVSPA